MRQGRLGRSVPDRCNVAFVESWRSGADRLTSQGILFAPSTFEANLFQSLTLVRAARRFVPSPATDYRFGIHGSHSAFQIR
jgi:hypothetical protein